MLLGERLESPRPFAEERLMTSLRQRMVEDMQVRRLSPFTQRTYVETVARFARYFGRSPDCLGPEQIGAYQVYLATERRLATSSLLVAVAALRFLYRVTLQKPWSFDDVIPAPKKPQSLPVVLSPQEVVQFLDAVKAPKHRAILTTCYAAGLRISEAIALRPRLLLLTRRLRESLRTHRQQPLSVGKVHVRPATGTPAVLPDHATPIAERRGSGFVQSIFSVSGAVKRPATVGRSPPRRQPKDALHVCGHLSPL